MDVLLVIGRGWRVIRWIFDGAGGSGSWTLWLGLLGCISRPYEALLDAVECSADMVQGS